MPCFKCTFHECLYAKSINDNLPVMKCSQCKKNQMFLKKTKKGNFMIGCKGYPNCKSSIFLPDVIINATITQNSCSDCGSDVKKVKITFSNDQQVPQSILMRLETHGDEFCFGGCNNELELIGLRIPLSLSLSNQDQIRSQNNFNSNSFNNTNQFNRINRNTSNSINYENNTNNNTNSINIMILNDTPNSHQNPNLNRSFGGSNFNTHSNNQPITHNSSENLLKSRTYNNTLTSNSNNISKNQIFQNTSIGNKSTGSSNLSSETKANLTSTDQSKIPTHNNEVITPLKINFGKGHFINIPFFTRNS